MTSTSPDQLYEVSINGDNQGLTHDYLELEPATMSHRETDNAMRSGPNPEPRTPMRRPDIKEPTNRAQADKNLQLQEKNALLKKVICVLIFVIVVYGIMLLIVSLVVFGVMQGFNGKDKDSGLQQTIGQPWYANMSGAVYVRWGQTTCPTVSEIAYPGIAGGKHFSHTGSGSNYLCLPEDPEYDVYQAGVDSHRAFIYSAEYEIVDFPSFAGKHQHDVPCAVCDTISRGRVLMIPAKMTCPSGWTNEYHGYLMAERHTHSSSEFVCVDRYPKVEPGNETDDNGALFYPVEGRCDSANLPCTPYINGAELTCVVCSK